MGLVLRKLHTFLKYISVVFFILRFSVNRRIFVVGFGLYGSIHGPTDYQVNIQVWIRTFVHGLAVFMLKLFIISYKCIHDILCM